MWKLPKPHEEYYQNQFRTKKKGYDSLATEGWTDGQRALLRTNYLTDVLNDRVTALLVELRTYLLTY